MAVSYTHLDVYKRQAISALAISEKFHTRAPGPPETMAVATPTIFTVPMVACLLYTSTDREGEIILKKYSPIGELNVFAKEYAEALAQ